MNRTTCKRCGNANTPGAVKCLACDATLPDFKACDHLEPDELAIFTAQVQNDINRARHALNVLRAAREVEDDRVRQWLQSLNRSKAYALKHGIKIDADTM